MYRLGDVLSGWAFTELKALGAGVSVIALAALRTGVAVRVSGKFDAVATQGATDS